MLTTSHARNRSVSGAARLSAITKPFFVSTRIDAVFAAAAVACMRKALRSNRTTAGCVRWIAARIAFVAARAPRDVQCVPRGK